MTRTGIFFVVGTSHPIPVHRRSSGSILCILRLAHSLHTFNVGIDWEMNGPKGFDAIALLLLLVAVVWSYRLFFVDAV